MKVNIFVPRLCRIVRAWLFAPHLSHSGLLRPDNVGSCVANSVTVQARSNQAASGIRLNSCRRRNLIIAMLSFLFLNSTLARADDQTNSKSDSLAKEIIECLAKGNEFLIDPKDRAQPCIPWSQNAAPALNPELPFNLDHDELDKICHDNDRRSLPPDIIKKIVARASELIGPTGIRLIGGVYCDRLDLAGLNLPYSLILDKAIFRKGIAARNLRVKGDFSLDDGIVFGYLTLDRARIDGSFYHGSGLIEREIVTDTKIDGTWHQSATVVFDYGEFQGVAISGDADFADSALALQL